MAPRTRRLHGVFALHACDTATCDAIALGVARAAELIAVAPCCQAELARGWTALAERGDAGAFAPIWSAPHLRREISAHVTDAMRTLLLRAAGYAVTPMEFIAAEHTKKNTLIRAIRRGAPTRERRARRVRRAGRGDRRLRLARSPIGSAAGAAGFWHSCRDAERAHEPEVHRSGRKGWLRAAVLGSDDAIVSTASLMIGVAASEASKRAMLIAGVAGLVAGAMSMAVGEYVSVSSQRDAEQADIELEKRELARHPQAELNELARST